jgi:hypothetical protein
MELSMAARLKKKQKKKKEKMSPLGIHNLAVPCLSLK